MKNNFEILQALNYLDSRIRRKLKHKKKDPYFSSKRMEGYEEAMLSVLSMIHNEKQKLNKESEE